MATIQTAVFFCSSECMAVIPPQKEWRELVAWFSSMRLKCSALMCNLSSCILGVREGKKIHNARGVYVFMIYILYRDTACCHSIFSFSDRSLEGSICLTEAYIARD